MVGSSREGACAEACVGVRCVRDKRQGCSGGPRMLGSAGQQRLPCQIPFRLLTKITAAPRARTWRNAVGQSALSSLHSPYMQSSALPRSMACARARVGMARRARAHKQARGHGKVCARKQARM